MTRKMMLSVALLSVFAITPYVLGAFGSSQAVACSCCGENCSCEVCKCDELACACTDGGQCACSAGCCKTCCNQED